MFSLASVSQLVTGRKSKQRDRKRLGRKIQRNLHTETLEDRRLLAQTVGLFTNTPDSAEGYTLFAPSLTHRTYLLDNAGNQVHAWPSNYDPGNSVYLQQDGSIWRTGSLGVDRVWPWNSAGVGGIVQNIDWEGNVVAEFELEVGTGVGGPDARVLHHDIEVLPNGNVAMIVFDYMSEQRARDGGRDPELIDAADENDKHLMPDSIIEVEFNENGRGKIVWEWHAEDHFVQDKFPNKANYAGAGKTVADHPGKIDINYVHAWMGPQADLTHANGLEYIEELDQFILSVRSFSEVWYIDHSTAWDPANGINEPAGPKGDLVYRWGNPAAYGAGTLADQQSFFQHDPLWVPSDSPEEMNPGSMTLYNNGHAQNRRYSTVSNVTPPIVYNPDGSFSHYELTEDLYMPGVAGWGPALEGEDWQELANLQSPGDMASGDEVHFSAIISGAQRLNNGNTLVTEGVTGTIFEVTPEDEVVWEYVSPFVPGGKVTQGQEVPPVPFFPPALNVHNNFVFKARRYEPSYLSDVLNTVWGDKAGLYNAADTTWYMNNRSDGTVHDLIVSQGEPAHSEFLPIAGDWDGDGIDTIGLYDNQTNTWYLNNNDTGVWDDSVIVLQGDPNLGSTLVPFAGDWDGPDGDGVTHDMPGLYDWRTNTWHLYNGYDAEDANVFQASVNTFSGPNHQQQSWRPIAGDWNGDGLDSVGLYVPSTNVWYLNNEIDGTIDDMIVARGPQHNSPGWRPIAGDWDLDGVDSIGLYVPGANIWYMNNKNDGSITDLLAFQGPAVPTSWMPIAGNWNGAEAEEGPSAFALLDPSEFSGEGLNVETTQLGQATQSAGNLDANVDGRITPADVLTVANAVNAGPNAQLSSYPDVTGDMMVNALDALRIINYLNREGATDAPYVALSTDDRGSTQPTRDNLFTSEIVEERVGLSYEDVRVREQAVRERLELNSAAGDRDPLLENILDDLAGEIADNWAG